MSEVVPWYLAVPICSPSGPPRWMVMLLALLGSQNDFSEWMYRRVCWPSGVLTV